MTHRNPTAEPGAWLRIKACPDYGASHVGQVFQVGQVDGVHGWIPSTNEALIFATNDGDVWETVVINEIPAVGDVVEVLETRYADDIAGRQVIARDVDLDGDWCADGYWFNRYDDVWTIIRPEPAVPFHTLGEQISTFNAAVRDLVDSFARITSIHYELTDDGARLIIEAKGHK